MIGLSHYLLLAAVLFTIGAIGVVVRRNALTVLMSIELMLNAANLTFVAFSRFPVNPRVTTVHQAMGGHASAFFVIAVAAAEAAVGLAILIAVFRTRQTAQVDEMNLVKDAPQAYEPGEEAAAIAAAPAHAHAESH